MLPSSSHIAFSWGFTVCSERNSWSVSLVCLRMKSKIYLGVKEVDYPC